MKIYEVGGAVRDFLMNKKPHDVDYVVVGSCPQEMMRQGFIQVGKSFPVFLHPKTKEEYALARKERKIGNRHTDFQFDFSPEITLSEDLRRRDFTCNALAKDIDTGEIIDENGGIADIKNKILRHIDAVHFVEDPLRVLRMCRFSAQLGFSIADETMVLAKKMVNEGMLLNLSADRFRNEFIKALQSENFLFFVKATEECGALKFLMPDLSESLENEEQHKKFYENVIASENGDALIRFVGLFRGVEDENKIIRDCRNIRMPKYFEEFALKFNKYEKYFSQQKTNDEFLFELVKDLTRFKNEEKMQNLFKALKFFSIECEQAEIKCDKIFEMCRKYKVNQLPNFANLPKNEQIQKIYREFILLKIKENQNSY